MTQQQSYVSFRKGQRNSCDRASQDVAFDLEKYGSYIDKIRALFVPSLEYRIRSLLEEFVYSTDSQSARQLPRFKRFVDAMAIWKGPLNKIVEYDVGMMEEVLRNIVNCTLKDDLIACFLDSIVLHHRLSKICRELDALGIEDNILRNLHVWNFVNEGYWANRDHLTNPDTAANGNTNSSVMTRHDAERPVEHKKVVQQLITSDVYCAGSTDLVQPITPDYRVRERRQIPLDLDQDIFWQAEDNQNHQVCSASGPQQSDTKEAREFLDKRSQTDEVEKIRSISRLKLIVRKVYLEDCGCSTLSRPFVTHLPLPCKPGDLIGRIFEADSSLTESCLIVMKRKFQVSVRNVCSCLNSILGKLNVEASRLTTRTLYLSCEIRPGYISFKLKTDGAAGTCKCLFVARIPICQNVHKRMVSCDSAASSSNAKLRSKLEELKCSERCEDNDTDFNDTVVCIKDESERVDDICCSRLNQSLIEDTVINTSRDRMENNNVKRTLFLCSINENIPKSDHELTICSHDKSEKIVETVSDVTLCIGDPKKRNKEHCKILDSNVIDCKKNTGESRNKILKSDNSTVRNNEQFENDINCACLPYENLADTNNEKIFSNKDLDSLSQTVNFDKHDWTCSSNKELDSGSTDCSRANTNSITSFVQNSERDKQLVELNYNRFSDNSVVKVNERLNIADVDLPNSGAKVGCDCSCCYDDFIDITVIDDVFEENCLTLQTLRNKLDTTKPQSVICSGTTEISSKDCNSLTISMKTPRLKVLSKGINVDISYPRTIAWLASGDDRSISSIVKTRDAYNEATDFLARPLTVSRKGKGIFHNVDEELFNTGGKIRGRIIRSLRRRTVSKERLRSNADSRHPGVSTEEDPRAGDYSTSLASNASRICRSFATGETKQGKIKKPHESRKLRLRYVRASSSNGVRSVTSVTTLKYRKTPRKRQADYSANVRSQTAFATNRFRKSIDKSVRWIKRLVRAKLAGAFFTNHQKAKTKSASRSFRGSDKSGYIERQTAGRYFRQGFCVTPSSNSDCRERDYTISHVDTSDVTLPCRRNWGKERSEGGIKLRDHRLAGGSEVLSSFRSIDTISPWSYDLLTLISEDLVSRELDGGSRRRIEKEETKNKRSPINYNENSCSRSYGDYEESITMSLRSAAMSLADDDSAEYFERNARKQRKKPRDGKRDRNRRASEEIQYRAERHDDKRRKLHEIRNVNDEFVKLSSIRTDEASDVCKRSHGIPRSRNARRPSFLGTNWEILDGAVKTAYLRRRRMFALLADTCHDCARDLDMEFEFTLSRYVKLCRNVKRSLIKTLWAHDIYEVSTTSMHSSDS